MKIESKVICLASSPEMAETFEHIMIHLKISLPILTAQVSSNGCETMDQNVADLLSAIGGYVSNGTEFVIARGTLAHMVQRVFPSIHVFNIPISENDVLRAVYPYLDQKKQIACVEDESFTECFAAVTEVLGIPAKVYKVASPEDFYPKYLIAKNDGAQVIFGGAWRQLYQKLVGEDYVEIKSSEKELSMSIESMLVLFEKLYREKRQKDLFGTVLNYSSEGILEISADGRIIDANRSAQKMLGREYEQLMGRPVAEIFPLYAQELSPLSHHLDRDIITESGGMRVVLDRVPLAVESEVNGAVFFFSPADRLQAIEEKLRLSAQKKGRVARHTFADIASENPGMKQVIALAQAYSRMESTILIAGETGCGKEFFAQAVHNHSPRKNNAFVAINCAAISSSLLESELFGYEDGAFTGAKKSGKVGIFEQAHLGTIFLDEIGEIDLAVQTRLLRVIQEREVMRIGGDKVIPIDVRIIAATNKDLRNEIAGGRFRMDLYYRLNVLNITIPPLRERREDLKGLVEKMIEEKNQQLGCKATGLEAHGAALLYQYNWPGNMRELSNVIEKIVVLTQSGVATLATIQLVAHELEEPPEQAEQDYGARSLDEIERICIENRLKRLHYNKAQTAKSLGISKATLFRKLEQYTTE